MNAGTAHRVTVRYADGQQRSIDVSPGQSVLEAADDAGVPIVSTCHSGICGTCVARCTEGRFELATSIGLNAAERAAGRVLCCRMTPTSDCTLDMDYAFDGNASRVVTGPVRVRALRFRTPDVALLTLDVSSLQPALSYRPGQFAQLRVPGTRAWRSYSLVDAAPSAGCVRILVRLLATGVMSDYLRSRCQVGDELLLRGARGDFHLRNPVRPIVLVASGTGISSVHALAQQLVREGCSQPIRLLYGARSQAHLVLADELDALVRAHPGLHWDAIVREGSPSTRWPIGDVADLLAAVDFNAGDVDVYACGAARLVDSTAEFLHQRGYTRAALYRETFVPSGDPGATRAQVPDSTPPDVDDLAARGRGTAVVIGGGIAGIATAKVLAETFARVIVLEKDREHRRMEGRAGAAQGWHLHHLLFAGQRVLEDIFPGIVDDMVRAGAFRVDMGEQYRLLLAGSWKAPATSGIDIVCAGRPLLEWCVRRRIDDDPRIEYRYGSEVTDIAFAARRNTSSGMRAGNVEGMDAGIAVGVEVQAGDQRSWVAAEFVVDASGKNTALPRLLAAHGFAAPPVDEDHINCFYSSMQHRVPPGRAWQDKVMVICYAHRPQQEHYAAQYFTDSSRTVLSTSLVGYNTYTPPRNAAEFREYARRMPSQAIGNELDGLEPCSPVYNFRYPTMVRMRYEQLRTLPGGLVAIGDAFSSADPVSGAGMSKAMLELEALRGLLRRGGPRDAAFARRYYRSVSRITRRVWMVIREQNLRFPWLPDVQRKRPALFQLQRWYVDRVFELMHVDAAVYRLFLAVTHFIRAPAALFAPAMVGKVLLHWLRARWRGESTLVERNFPPEPRAARATDAAGGIAHD